MDWLKDKCSHVYELSIHDPEFRIYGCKNTVYTGNVLDGIILFAKYFINKCKVKDVSKQFQTRITHSLNIEKCIHFN